jgi:MoxR-like ATPase
MEKIKHIKSEIHKVVVGQEHMIDAILMAIICDGHILLEGVPGLAKTTTVKTVAKVIDLEFKRVQFTPDLLPSDILGAEIYDPKNNEFKIKKGPIFTNLLLADEINRAPAKVQSALLEVMQEKQITIGDDSFKLSPPFLVMATQNPVESEGAYTLPEAQLDRFMFKVVLDYNTKEQELAIARRVANNLFEEVNRVIDANDLKTLKEEVSKVYIDPQVEEYIVDLIYATREPKEYGLAEIDELIEYGASPRATIDLLKVVKAHAYLRAREYVTPVDVASVFKEVLRHRVILSYEALAQEISSDNILDKILETVDIP